MADTKISALTAASAALLADELPANEAGTSKKVTLAQIQALLGVIKKVLGADVSNSTTTAAKITGLDTTLGAGLYRFIYFVRYQAAATSTGIKFSINHTGTATFMVTQMRWVDTGSSATGGTATQAGNAAGGLIQGAFSQRALSTAGNMGPTAGVDTANADLLCIIEGLIRITVSGDLQLYSASEVAAASTVKADTCLEIVQMA